MDSNGPTGVTLPTAGLFLSLIGAVFLMGCSSVEKPALSARPSGRVDEPLGADADTPPPPSVDEEEQPLLSANSAPSYSPSKSPHGTKSTGQIDVPLRRSWDYIVVHHSYSRKGSEAIFDDYHKNVRGWLGVGYHFVIGNGHGSPDGAVEVTFRWEKQLHGAHAGVDKYNQHGIGICLVGNFEKTYPTPAQMRSLVSLTNYLQNRCHVPTSRVLLHRHVRNTKCPGELFPFYQFISLLDH